MHGSGVRVSPAAPPAAPLRADTPLREAGHDRHADDTASEQERRHGVSARALLRWGVRQDHRFGRGGRLAGRRRRRLRRRGRFGRAQGAVRLGAEAPRRRRERLSVEQAHPRNRRRERRGLALRPRQLRLRRHALRAALAAVFNQGLSAIAATAFGTPTLARRSQRFARSHVRPTPPLSFAPRRARVFRRPSKPAHPIGISHLSATA